MNLLCVGLNWKTPVHLRERLSIDDSQYPFAIADLKEATGDFEYVILSTCNRTEIYVGQLSERCEMGAEWLCEFLARFHDVPLPEFYDHLYFHEDAGAAYHLFQVASGLDSLILGEGQILAQCRQAYRRAVEIGCAGSFMHPLFQRAFTVAKRVRTETTLSEGRLSIASAAVDYVRGVFDQFGDKTVLVIGGGKMAELTLTHLKELRPKQILVSNRSRRRAEDLAERFEGEVRAFEELHAALAEADIVISGTGAAQPIVRASDFHKVLSARRHRLMAIVDIAMPRDFEEAIGDLDNVWLWNIDDLEKVRFRTLRAREKELDRALKIVDQELRSYQSSLTIQRSGPLIGRLEKEFQQIVDQELEWLLPQLAGVGDAQQEKIRHFAHRLKNKFLHPPKAALREEARNGASHPGLVEAVRKLFGIADDA